MLIAILTFKLLKIFTQFIFDLYVSKIAKTKIRVEKEYVKYLNTFNGQTH